jgi:sugar O-acyltransferase (sialic acid O-acetyltransferase NeuD family)
MIIIGYSGHAFVVCGIITAAAKKITGYCDSEEKQYNPFSLQYFGKETSETALALQQLYPGNAIHPSAVVDVTAIIASHGVMIAANAVINPLAKIGTGAICNTGSIIEHECIVGDFAHIAPGAVLCGNVKVGSNSFVGANAVVRQGITIGNNVMIGAGAVVLKDIPDNVTVIGVPAK